MVRFVTDFGAKIFEAFPPPFVLRFNPSPLFIADFARMLVEIVFRFPHVADRVRDCPLQAGYIVFAIVRFGYGFITSSRI